MNELDKYTVEQIVLLISNLDVDEFVEYSVESAQKDTGGTIGDKFIDGLKEGAAVVKLSLKEVLEGLCDRL